MINRPRLIMLKILPIMLLSSAQKIAHYAQYYALHPVLHLLSLFIMALLNSRLGTNCLINLVHSCLQSFGTQIIMEWYISYEVWQRLSNNMPVYFAYYAGTMLDAFDYRLCFLLCWHNRPGPNDKYRL